MHNAIPGRQHVSSIFCRETILLLLVFTSRRMHSRMALILVQVSPNHIQAVEDADVLG